jgi:GDPmannose 4,6-dehydratase
MSKTALICGISGQDGAWLSVLLLEKGYTVWGTSRDHQGNSFRNLRKLGVYPQIDFLSMVPEDFRSVFTAVKKAHPDEIYFLAGQSSVGLSFDQPAETMQSIVLGTLNMLEACRLMEYQIKLYHAGSSECFGDLGGLVANEKTPFSPRSPYAVAKSSAFWLVNNYREAYSLFACTGILFNHESPLRPERFVTQKIVRAAKRISKGFNETLNLGRLDIARDWGWATEYVEAMWLMLQQAIPEDIIVATGQTYTLEEFVNEAFSSFGLHWRDHVVQDPKFFRPTDLLVSRADPGKAEKVLGWKTKIYMHEVVQRMIDGVSLS